MLLCLRNSEERLKAPLDIPGCTLQNSLSNKQGAWREVSGQGAAHRKRTKAFRGGGGGTTNAQRSRSSPAASPAIPMAVIDWAGEPGSADLDATFATEAFLTRARSRNRSPPARSENLWFKLPAKYESDNQMTV